MSSRLPVHTQTDRSTAVPTSSYVFIFPKHMSTHSLVIYCFPNVLIHLSLLRVKSSEFVCVPDGFAQAGTRYKDTLT